VSLFFVLSYNEIRYHKTTEMDMIESHNKLKSPIGTTRPDDGSIEDVGQSEPKISNDEYARYPQELESNTKIVEILKNEYPNAFIELSTYSGEPYSIIRKKDGQLWLPPISARGSDGQEINYGGKPGSADFGSTVIISCNGLTSVVEQSPADQLASDLALFDLSPIIYRHRTYYCGKLRENDGDESDWKFEAHTDSFSVVNQQTLLTLLDEAEAEGAKLQANAVN
jgi:hypothetical protein